MDKCQNKKTINSTKTHIRNHCSWIKVIKISNNRLITVDFEEIAQSWIFKEDKRKIGSLEEKRRRGKK